MYGNEWDVRHELTFITAEIGMKTKRNAATGDGNIMNKVQGKSYKLFLGLLVSRKENPIIRAFLVNILLCED